MSALTRCGHHFRAYSHATRHLHPLHVLFCGSDSFSIHSLRALNALRVSKPEIIDRIDVVCRPDKRIGRGLKQIHAVPIKAVSQNLDLPLQQLDTFREWRPVNGTPDLIVTASFGLLVPASVLSQAKFGGLNVHPSLLPQFRGAAPIQHAIMRRVQTTGVSVQTMHPTKFDHGIVLAQEAYQLIDPVINTADLTERLGIIGGRLLVDSIKQTRYIDPQPIATSMDTTLFKAPKIQPSDRMIDWNSWSAADITAHDRALGNLWDRTTVGKVMRGTDVSDRRIVFNGPWSIVGQCSDSRIAAGDPLLHADQTGVQQTRLAFKTIDSCLIAPEHATIEGEAKNKGLPYLQRMLIAT